MTSLFFILNINRIIMKKLLIALLLFSVFSQIEAQQLLTERLQRKLNNLDQYDELVSIRIYMLNKVDSFETETIQNIPEVNRPTAAPSFEAFKSNE